MIRHFQELWRHRALIWALVVRHLNARYRGSMLGFLWSFLNPLCLIGVYSLVFRYYVRFENVEHYTLFMFAGLLPWIWFSSGVIEATSAVTGGGSLVTKSVLPPQILPAVAVLTHLANFLFAVPLLLIFMYICGVTPGLEMLTLPVVILVELTFVLGLGLALSALNVYYRDIQHILANLITLWFFLCPIIYPASNVPEKLRFTLWLNPVALFTEMYQGIFVDNSWPQWEILVLTGAISLITLIVGAMIFERYRDNFAELI